MYIRQFLQKKKKVILCISQIWKVVILAFTLYDYEIENKELPSPSDLHNISVEANEFANYIQCDTLEYRKMHNNKAVKKTLTIPEWLNEEAAAKGVNFSAVLQEALKERIGITD